MPEGVRGPVVRGEACADSFYAALESAVCKLESRLRRSNDRRKVHYGDKTPVSWAQATALDPVPETTTASAEPDADGAAVEDHEPGRIVRTKDHPAKPMTTEEHAHDTRI